MTVSIVLPPLKDGEVRSSLGTRVFNSDGEEIKNVIDIKIHLSNDDIALATIKVAVSNISNLDGLELTEEAK